MTTTPQVPAPVRARSRAGTKGVPRGDREAQILEVAAREFGASGYAATSVVTVAAGAGISKPLVYQYFGSKEGLYAACLEQVGSMLGDEVERIARGDAVGIERGMLTLAGMFDVLDGQPHLWRILFDATAPAEGPVAEVRATYGTRIEALALDGVGELLALRGYTDPRDVSAMTTVWLGIVDSLMTWWADHPAESAEEMTGRGLRLLDALFADAAGLSFAPEALGRR